MKYPEEKTLLNVNVTMGIQWFTKPAPLGPKKAARNVGRDMNLTQKEICVEKNDVTKKRDGGACECDDNHTSRQTCENDQSCYVKNINFCTDMELSPSLIYKNPQRHHSRRICKVAADEAARAKKEAGKEARDNAMDQLTQFELREETNAIVDILKSINELITEKSFEKKKRFSSFRRKPWGTYECRGAI